MKIDKLFSVFSVMCLLLTSCARTYQVVPLASQNQSRASICVYRKGILDFNAGVKIYCNDTFIGKVASRRYLKWSVDNGHYVIKAKSGRKALCSFDIISSGDYQLIAEKKLGIPYGMELRMSPEKLKTQSIQPPAVKHKN